MKKSIIVVFGLCYLMYGCTNTAKLESEVSNKPNIIFIMADDLGYGDLGVYGQKQIKTPHIDKLASEGIIFTQMYAGSTVCAPSRNCLMTGQHTGHTTIRGNIARGTILPTDTTVAEMMKMAGYTTGLIGKWGIGEEGTPGIPNKKGFDYFYGYLNQIRAHNYYPTYVWENNTHDSLDNIVEIIDKSYAKGIGGMAVEKNTYIQDKFMEKAFSFIEQNKDSSFFLYMAVTLPHANNESWNWDKSGMEIPDVGQYEKEDWPLPQKQHAAMISYLDQDVGRIIEKLKNLNLDKNTIVIFTSDNGPHDEGGADHTYFDSNGILRGAKRDLFEGGIRVPLIARWPGNIKPESRTNLISAFWDVMPTLCEIAEVNPPRATDGISFVPTLLDNGDQKKHEYLYWEFFELGGKQAIRKDNWKYIKLNVNDQDQLTPMLFDLGNDPSEENNVVKEHPDIVEQMELLMKDAHVQSNVFQFTYEVQNTGGN